MARRCTARAWADIVDEVFARAPLPRDYHVTAKRVGLADSHGWAECLDDTGRFAIVVSDRLSEAHAADILIHEVAHVLDWRPTTAWTCDHGPTFWIHYGEVWRAYYQAM